MKTNKNSQTHIGAEHLSQSELTGSGTNTRKAYEIIFILAQRSSGSATVEAASAEEARQKAGQIELHEVDDWNVFEDEMSIESIEVAKGGQDNE